MSRFLVKRVAQLLFVVWAVLTLLFVFVRMSGDPALIIAGPTATAEVLERVRSQLGLDGSLVSQYQVFMGDVVRLDFGQSYSTGERALPLLLGALPASLSIAVPALLIATVLAFIVGIYAALRNGTRRGQAVVLTTWLGDAMPFFVLAYLFILVFAVSLGWLPAGGGDGVSARVLPVAAMVIPQVATLSRLVRGQLLDVLGQPYVVAARSTGAHPRRVLLQALPNAIPPVVSFLGIMMGFFLTVLLVVEPIFNFPGFGGLLIRAVVARDFPVVQAAIFVVATVIVSANILADLVNRLIDPRIAAKESGV